MILTTLLPSLSDNVKRCLSCYAQRDINKDAVTHCEIGFIIYNTHTHLYLYYVITV